MALTLCQNGEVEVLMELGLASRQAKVLLALTRLGTATAHNLADALSMPRQDVYKILTELKQAGLIEKHLTAPIKFKAFPLKETFSILMSRRNQETSNLNIKAEKILSDFESGSNETKYDEKESQMVLIPESEALLHRLLKAVKNSKRSIDIVSSGKPSQRGLLMAEAFEKAVERGVKIRYLADKIERANMQSEVLQEVIESTNFEARIIRNRPIAKFRIFDKKEVIVTLFPLKDFTKSPALWSNNPNFIALFSDYFETLWFTAEAYQPKNAAKHLENS